MKKKRLASLTSAWALSLVLITISGCSSGQSSAGTSAPPTVSITISPTSANVQVGSTAQFSSSVSGSTNVSVVWQVNGVTGGAATSGIISSSGLYTAPMSVPSPSTVTVTAVSSADSTKSASATVSILPLPVTVTVTPSSAGVIVSQSQQFAATVSNTANTSVVWNVNGVAGGSAQNGTISTTGLYTAPSSVPSPSTVTVTAVSSADSTKSGSVTVSILPLPVNVVVAPASAGVVISRSQQFSATVSNTSNTAVVWGVNGTNGGSTESGTISTTGLYTAPSTVPSTPVVTVTATSVADNTKASSSQVTIEPLGTFSYLAPSGITGSAVLVADPNNSQTMYAAPVQGGLYKTTTLGQSWSLILSTFTEAAYSPVIAPGNGTIYALAENSYQASTDGGKTFSASTNYPSNLDSETSGFTFAVDPKDDQSIYILSGSALLHSADGGSTWNTLTSPPAPYVASGLPAPAIGGLLVSNGNSSVLMSASCGGFAISTDTGSTWHLQNTGLDPNFLCLRQIVQDSMNPNRLLALGHYSGTQVPPNAEYIYISTDGGTSWTKVETFVVTAQLCSNQTGPGIYVFNANGLFESFDSGQHGRP